MGVRMGKTEVIEALIRAGCLLRGTFRLSSGKISDVYVDVRRLYSHPAELKVVVADLVEIVRQLSCDYIAGVESGGIPLATLCSYILDKPLIYVRKKPKEHGTQRMIEGHVEGRGAIAVVVDDVATTGLSILRAVAVLREAGLGVRDALVVIDREEGAGSTLKDSGVTLHSLLKLKELLHASAQA